MALTAGAATTSKVKVATWSASPRWPEAAAEPTMSTSEGGSLVVHTNGSAAHAEPGAHPLATRNAGSMSMITWKAS
eukprot:6977969-Pyramimonas_sp.AAC.1